MEYNIFKHWLVGGCWCFAVVVCFFKHTVLVLPLLAQIPKPQHLQSWPSPSSDYTRNSRTAFCFLFFSIYSKLNAKHYLNIFNLSTHWLSFNYIYLLFLQAQNFCSSFVTVLSCVLRSQWSKGVCFILGQTSKRWTIYEYLHNRLKMIPYSPDAWRIQHWHTGNIQLWSSYQRRQRREEWSRNTENSLRMRFLCGQKLSHWSKWKFSQKYMKERCKSRQESYCKDVWKYLIQAQLQKQEAWHIVELCPKQRKEIWAANCRRNEKKHCSLY